MTNKKGSISKRRGSVGKVLLTTTLAGTAATGTMAQSTSASAALFDFFKNTKSSITSGLSKSASYTRRVSTTILSSIGLFVSKLIDKLNPFRIDISSDMILEDEGILYNNPSTKTEKNNENNETSDKKNSDQGGIGDKSNSKVDDKNASNTETVNQDIEEHGIERENLNKNSNNNKDYNNDQNFSNENLDIEKAENKNGSLNDKENGKRDGKEEYEEDDENDEEKTAEESILDELKDDKSLAKQLNEKAFYSISDESRRSCSEFAKINENINILWKKLEDALDAYQKKDKDNFNKIKEKVRNTKETIKELIEGLLKKLEKIKSQSDELSKIYNVYENLLSAFNNKGAPEPETYVNFYVEINNALKGEEYQINKKTFLEGLKEKFGNNLLGKRFKNVKL